MSITIADGQSNGQWSAQNGYSITTEFKAAAPETDPVPGPKAILTSLGLNYGDTYRWPLTGTPSETDGTLYMQTVTAQPDPESDWCWSGTIIWAPFNPQQQGIDDDGEYNPFSIPPSVRCRSENEEVAASYDRDGNDVRNTAGDPLPGLTFPTAVHVFEIQRFEPDFPLALIASHKNRLNDGVWEGFPAESLLCQDIQASKTFDAKYGDYVWDVTYVLAYREPLEVTVGGDDYTLISGWAATILNAGMRQKVGGSRKQIIVDGAPVSDPVPLKSDGTVAGPTDDPYYLSFNLYPTADFDLLGLPSGLF